MSIRSQWYRLCRVAPDLPARAGHRWTAFEKNSLKADYLAAVVLHTLASKHRRSRYAIAQALVKLKVFRYEARALRPYFEVLMGPDTGRIVSLWQLSNYNNGPVRSKAQGRRS